MPEGLSSFCCQLYSGMIPFPDRLDPVVILMVSSGERPSKPASAEVLGLTEEVWELTRKCWRGRASKRPNASEILDHLEGTSLPAIHVLGSEFIDAGGLIGTIVVPTSPSIFKRVKKFFARR